jgi:hypothetical protein
MFLKIKPNSFVSYCKNSSIITPTHEFFINLSTVDEISIKRCAETINIDGRIVELCYQIQFDKFLDEGTFNQLILFFETDKDIELERIKQIIEK